MIDGEMDGWGFDEMIACVVPLFLARVKIAVQGSAMTHGLHSGIGGGFDGM